MKFIVLFKDNPGAGDEIRSRHMHAHLAFLERRSTMVEAAGPLKEADGAAAGGVWIVEANNAGEVRSLVEEDPFWPTGLRQSVKILTWSQVYANGNRLAKG